mgnify:CR=1 FL=1
MDFVGTTCKFNHISGAHKLHLILLHDAILAPPPALANYDAEAGANHFGGADNSDNDDVGDDEDNMHNNSDGNDSDGNDDSDDEEYEPVRLAIYEHNPGGGELSYLVGPEGGVPSIHGEWRCEDELPIELVELFTLEQQILQANTSGSRRKRKAP